MQPLRINPASRTPRYLQVKSGLLRLVQHQGLEEGDRLPSEEHLVRLCGVSKMTVRAAISDLVKEGVLRRNHGLGTFVARPRALRRFWTVLSFTEEMRAWGLAVENRLLSVRRMSPPDPVRRALRLAPGERVLQVRRLRLVHGRPVAYNVSHIPLSRCPDLDRRNLAEESLYTIIERHYNVRFTRCDRSYRAAAAGVSEARLLEVAARAPVLIVEGTAFVGRGVPIDYCYEVYRE